MCCNTVREACTQQADQDDRTGCILANLHGDVTMFFALFGKLRIEQKDCDNAGLLKMCGCILIIDTGTKQKVPTSLFVTGWEILQTVIVQ